ncbi:MAG: hypothetical protein V1653_04170 [bacterium]
MVKKIVLYLVIASFAVTLTACSDFNLFSWAHKKGSSADKDVLISDGEVALNKKDYNDAKTYFEKVLEGDPNNSVALYGYTQAVMGASGLGLADIISAVIQQSVTGSAPSLGDYNYVFYPSPKFGAVSDLLPATLDLKKLYDTSVALIPKLKKIADGQGDGVIPADDVDVNVNLGVYLALRAVCELLDTNGDGTPGGTGDLVQVYSNYNVTLPTQAQLDALTKAQITAFRNKVQNAVWGIVGGGTESYDKGALDYFLVAINKIGAKSGSALSDLKGNIDEFKADQTNGINALKKQINDQITANYPDIPLIQ